MHNEAMKTNPLQERIDTMRITDAELAFRVGCTRSTITRIRLGISRPSLALAKRLGEHTGLAVERFDEIERRPSKPKD